MEQTIGTYYKRHVLIFAILVVPFFVFLGFYLRRTPHAVETSSVIEAESSTLSGPVSIGDDASASGGKYVQFITSASVAPTPSTGNFFPRGMFENNDGTHVDIFKSLGFNTVNIGRDRASLDALAQRGVKGVVWLGDYDNNTCQFEQSDSTIQNAVTLIKGHSAILAYFLADEPEQALERCPSVADQLKARSDLVKSIDSSVPTYALISNSAYIPGHTIEYYPYHYFVGKTDIMGLDIYPCPQPATSSCDFADIDRAIAAADSQGVSRYWAVLQDFEDSIWRRPTPDEVKAQFDHWDASRMEGYFVFSWDWQGNTLDGNTAHQDMLKTQNARQF